MSDSKWGMGGGEMHGKAAGSTKGSHGLQHKQKYQI